MFPLDTAKTHMQVSRSQLGLGAAFRAVLCERGTLGLMRGSAVIGAGCVPAHVGLFGTYELSMASVAHDVVLTPHDVVKQQLQLGRYAGTADCIASLMQKDGLAAFYRSLPTTMAMNVPFMGLLVAANESLKLLLRLRQGRADATLSGASGYFACAGASGGFASALTSPLDVVKTRLQTSDMPAILAEEPPDAAGVARGSVG
ncbi:unnamed protein product [Prorocentrum cordatum]|uniref:Uncharacterized protein n=1 Tax=Prorocentrum cordatum TaxID=2364126 RepID=A0ABN9V6J0_9DINO|nr:unnamed protein product [Polarella glacialis]